MYVVSPLVATTSHSSLFTLHPSLFTLRVQREAGTHMRLAWRAGGPPPPQRPSPQNLAEHASNPSLQHSTDEPILTEQQHVHVHVTCNCGLSNTPPCTTRVLLERGRVGEYSELDKPKTDLRDKDTSLRR